MHSRTTALEILEAFDGAGLDYWVTGYGTGERYLSTPLFENIEAGMTDEEKQLSASTPSWRFE